MSLIKFEFDNYTLGYDLFELNKYDKVLFVTCVNVSLLYLDKITKVCNNYITYIIEDGEESKNINNYQNIITLLLKNNFSKSDLLIGIGGGVVGDLCGYVASTYKRGIKSILYPTTLLSIVDSSIGDKNGINYSYDNILVKNVLGTFYKHHKIYSSLETLKTLDSKQLFNGFIEIIKIFFISNIKKIDYLLNLDYKNLDIEVIKESIEYKFKIVGIDLYEKNYRRVLNFGHTLGHAIEASSSLLHGESVLLGMIPFIKNDYYKKRLKEYALKHLEKLILDIDKIKTIVFNDKKWKNNSLVCVFLENEDIILKEVSIEELEELIYEVDIWK